jgi:phage/plasmid-associated DNA primase
VEIDPKHEHQYTAVLRAVVVATNNTPMIFTERAGGVARRGLFFSLITGFARRTKTPICRKRYPQKFRWLSAAPGELFDPKKQERFCWNRGTVKKHWRLSRKQTRFMLSVLP